MNVLSLPYPPSANRYWRNFRGRMVPSRDAVEYRESVQQIASGSGIEPVSGCVMVYFTLHPPLPKDWKKREKKDPENWIMSVRRVDLDNALKVVFDALQGICYNDDRQIIHLQANLGQPVQDGGLTAIVVPLATYIDTSRGVQ